MSEYSEHPLATRADWLEFRRQGIGASDAPIILGLSSWKSPFGLYAEKTGLIEMSQEETELLEWGKRLEPAIAGKYTDETARVTTDPGEFTIYRSESAPFQLATLDRVVVGQKANPPREADVYPGDGPGVLELKNVIEFKREDWAEEPPLLYQVQVQHQLAVTGFKWGSIAAIIGGRTFVWADIPRNERFIALLLEKEEAFWKRVVDQNPPPPDGSDATAEALKALFPKEANGQIVAAPPELIQWADQLEASKLEKKAAERRETEAENYIKAFIGANMGCILPNGAGFTLKTQRRAGYTVAPNEFRVLRRTGR